MYVRQVDISEFRGIRKCSEPITFTRFTVLIGRNDSGKSAILEVLSLLPHPMLNVPFKADVTRLDFIRQLHSEKPLVYGYSGAATVIYTIDDEKWTLQLDSLHNAGFSLENESKIDYFDLAKRLKLEPKDMEKRVVFLPNDTEIIKELDSKLMDLKNDIMKLGVHVSTARDISECVDDRFTEILLESKELSMRKELPDGNVFYIQLADLGDGIKKAVKFMLLLEVLKPKIVLLDDFEAAVHPGLLKLLLKWLSTKDWQVVLSTHSIDVLYRLLDIRPDDLSVVQFRKTEDDILLHESLSFDDLEGLIDANQDPRLLVDALRLG